MVPQGIGVLVESLGGECVTNSLIIKRTRQTLEDLKQGVLYIIHSHKIVEMNMKVLNLRMIFIPAEE